MSEETQRRREKKKTKQEVEDKGEEEDDELWRAKARDPVRDGRQQLGRKEKKEGGGHISHGGFEYKQFLPSILFRATMLALKAAAPVEHSTHLLNKTECRNQRRRVGPADRGKIWIFVAAVC